jgi:hypothetical protein
MSNVLRPYRCRRLVVWLLLSSGLAGCTRWEVQELTPQQVITEMKPMRIRVIRTDSARLVFARPQIAGDSVIGSVPGRRMSVPLSEVVGISVQKGNPGGTVALLLGLFAAAGLAFVAIGLSGNYN